MESNRRFRRPRNVVRMVRKLRTRATSTTRERVRKEPGLGSPVPLKLVGKAPVAPALADEQANELGGGLADGSSDKLSDGVADRATASTIADPQLGAARSWVPGKLVLYLLLLTMVGLLCWWMLHEIRTSRMQAKFFSGIASELKYKTDKGPSSSIRYPADSPYDTRLGYARLPDFLDKLAERNFVIDAQARISPRMAELSERGLNSIYPEKSVAGLSILDCRTQPLFATRYPERSYAGFEQVPSLLVKSLLFIENRELLDTTYPKRNPAVEWDRFAKAVMEKSLNVATGADRRSAGGSTLATQIEKYRHSHEGRTSNLSDKLLQMASATLRSYQYGQDTTLARRAVVTDYLNTVPLSAKLGFGEVNGIGDGMWVWYGREFASMNQALTGIISADAARAYKQALSLMIAQRRPAHYLGAGSDDLEQLTDFHLRLLAREGVITAQLRDAALGVSLAPLRGRSPAPPEAATFVTRKAANSVRVHLGGLLGDASLYNLDRLDLSVVSTLDADAQRAVTAQLRQLSDSASAEQAGLTGKGMLGNGDPSKVIYSFTLIERGAKVNYLRVQTDNYDQPLDINEGAMLDLGSTAKLRTLVTYLHIVERLHHRFAVMDGQELSRVMVDPKDHLTQWAIEHFSALPEATGRGLPEMLEAALERRYSASPHERFFTGGGLHTFGNFSKLDDARIMSVRQALRSSTNLVFVRLMRDVARYYMFQLPGSSAALLANADDPRRAAYLSRFADREGREFLRRFYNKYKGKSVAETEKKLLASLRPTPIRLANVHRTIAPQATLAQFGAFINGNLVAENEVSEERLERLYDQYAPANMSLSDRGYLATIHPLELWLVGYLRSHPDADFSAIAAASADQRQEVYAWLFNTHRKHAQDRRIAGLLEVEAFLKIHEQWKSMGYPFDSLVPSYATTLGASADRPAALAEMMGIIVNEGVRKPVRRIDSLHFAAGTPYDTLVRHGPVKAAEQVIAPEVARAVANAVREVVTDGTAKRVKSAFVLSDGRVIAIGGKTGTGDQRFEVYGAGGRVLESRFVNRSATFVFNIGERFFGSMTAYVAGPQAENYDFTSALPVQLLATLAPALMPVIEPPMTPGATQCVR